MTRRVIILAVLLALCASARASGPMALLSIMDSPSGGNPYAAWNPVAVWYPSKTLDYTDIVNGLTATNASRTGVVVSADGITFNGVSGSYLDYGRNATLEPGTSRHYALTIWMKATNTGTLGLIGKSFAGGDTNGRFAVSTLNPIGVSAVAQAGGTYIDASPANKYSLGAWTHVAMTLDRSTGGYLRVWVNGSNVHSAACYGDLRTPADKPMTVMATHPFLIGSYGAPGAYLFKGSLDLAAVFRSDDSEFSTNFIQSIYATGRTP